MGELDIQANTYICISVFFLVVDPCQLFALIAQDCAVLCLVAQSCPTLCNPMDCNLPGSSVCRILQARILEWATMYSSRGSSQPRD